MNSLRKIMAAPLPPMTYQRKRQYRPSARTVKKLYHLINATIFENKLSRPELDIRPRLRRYYGMCISHWDKVKYRNTYCKIILLDKWPCKQWLVTVLAHEIAHQYQWDIDRIQREADGKKGLMSHGPSFFRYKKKMAEHGITLSTNMDMDKWFKYQSLD